MLDLTIYARRQLYHPQSMSINRKLAGQIKDKELINIDHLLAFSIIKVIIYKGSSFLTNLS